MHKKHLGRLIVTILLLLFGGPYFAAYWLFHHPDLLHANTTNKGTLIQPPLDVTQLVLNDSAVMKKIQGKWTLLLFEPYECLAQCQKNLYYLEQIQKATGKNQDRVQRLLLSFRELAVNRYTVWQKISSPEKFVQLFGALQPAGSIFVVDPRGDIMLAYKPGSNYMDIFKDLQQLLRVGEGV